MKKKKKATPTKNEGSIADDKDFTEGGKSEELSMLDDKDTKVNDSLDYKLYRRWVWIMFPWLALSNGRSCRATSHRWP